MKSTRVRKEKGITLIALIITIVVLMVLAAVAISSIQNDGIIAHANNAAIQYNTKQDEEQTILGGYQTEIDKYAQGIGNSGEGNGSGGNQEPVILATPTISVSGDTLTITAVTSATSYDVYVNNTLKTNTTSTIVDLTEFNLEAGTYNITVQAKAEGYVDSVVSNSISYVIEAVEEGFSVTYGRDNMGDYPMFASGIPSYPTITLTFMDDSQVQYRLMSGYSGDFPSDWCQVTGAVSSEEWNMRSPYVWTNVKSVYITVAAPDGTPVLYVNNQNVGTSYSATLTENITFYNDGGSF